MSAFPSHLLLADQFEGYVIGEVTRIIRRQNGGVRLIVKTSHRKAFPVNFNYRVRVRVGSYIRVKVDHKMLPNGKVAYWASGKFETWL